MGSTSRTRTRAKRACSVLSALLVIGASSACGRGGDEEGHDHGEEGHADELVEPKTDAHHVAENRRDCEDDVELPPGALERYGIEVAPVRAVALVPRISAPGHLAFPQGGVARVGSAVVGRIAEVRVRTGDSVAKGDPLLVVESADLGAAQSEYLQQRTVAATAASSVELARSAFDRARQLYDSVQGVALTEVQRREAELRQLERDRDLARAAESAARDRLLLQGMTEPVIREIEETGKVQPRVTIASPIAGRVVDVTATLGELVTPQKDRLLVIGDTSTLWAIAEVSESRLAEVALGAPARVRVPALQDATYAGRVSAVPVTIEASIRTAEVRIDVPNADGALLPGMFIQVEIDSSRGAGAPTLAVPDGAVVTVEGRPSVFVPLEPGGSVFCKHTVQVGEPVGEQIPVLGGLAAGELVVVDGVFRLKAEHGKAAAQHEH